MREYMLRLEDGPGSLGLYLQVVVNHRTGMLETKLQLSATVALSPNPPRDIFCSPHFFYNVCGASVCVCVFMCVYRYVIVDIFVLLIVWRSH